MRKLLLASVLALSLLPVSSRAQVSAGISINFPVPTFVVPAQPPLVVVQPGVQVVEDCDHEVFYHRRFWWMREDGRWYRARDRRHWAFVEDRGVPPGLYRLPPGQYKHWRRERGEWRGQGGRGPGEWRGHGEGHGHGHGEGRGHGRWDRD